MLNPEKYFDDIYEYADLWVSGYVHAYCPEMDNKMHHHIKVRMIESVMERLDVINDLRSKLGLSLLSIDASYEYYINNLPVYNELEGSIDLTAYDNLTQDYAKLGEGFASDMSDVKIYLILMGAPRIFLENSAHIQRRLDNANRLFVEGGYASMKPVEIESLLVRMLKVSNDY